MLFETCVHVMEGLHTQADLIGRFLVYRYTARRVAKALASNMRVLMVASFFVLAPRCTIIGANAPLNSNL